MILRLSVILAIIAATHGAEDVNVEQIEEIPHVAKSGIGPHASIKYNLERPKRSYGHGDYASDDHGARCISCGKLGGSATAAASASASASAGFSANVVPSGYKNTQYNSYNYKPQSSSSHQEYNQQQQFMNGQKVSDFYEQKRYENGQLVHHDKSRMGSPISQHGTEGAASAFATSGSYAGSNAYHQPAHSAYGLGASNFHADLQTHLAKMQAEMRRNTMNIDPLLPLVPVHTTGESHRSEMHHETKYVNGQPIYVKKAEKRYQNGQLVHNVIDEKGPQELGISSHGAQNQDGSVKSQYPYLSGSSQSSSDASSSHANYDRYGVNSYPTTGFSSYSSWSSGYQPSSIQGPVIPNTYSSSLSNSSAVGSLGYRPSVSHQQSVVSTHEERVTQSSQLPQVNTFNNQVDGQYRQSQYHRSRPVQNPSSLSVGKVRNEMRTEDIHSNARSYQPTSHIISEQENTVQKQRQYNYPTTPIEYQPRVYVPSLTDNQQISTSVIDEESTKTVKQPVPHTQPQEGRPVSRAPVDRHYESVRSEKERYDISPYEDELPQPKRLNQERVSSSHSSSRSNYDTRYHVPQTPESFSNNAQPKRNPHEPNQHSSAQYYAQSRTQSTSGTQGSIPAYDIPYGGYSRLNTTFSMTPRQSVLLPSRWVETRTTHKYRNGILIGEVKHHRYFENGALTHENSTERTRQQMMNEGVDVALLDLTRTQLASYGIPVGTQMHSQRHESHQIRKFQNGIPIYELSEEKRYQDGQLVHQNRTEKDEDDLKQTYPAYLTGKDVYNEVYKVPGFIAVPSTSVRKHEVHKKEQFVNGQQVYDLHHEKKYENGELTHEQRQELGPKDFMVASKAADVSQVQPIASVSSSVDTSSHVRTYGSTGSAAGAMTSASAYGSAGAFSGSPSLGSAYSSSGSTSRIGSVDNSYGSGAAFSSSAAHSGSNSLRTSCVTCRLLIGAHTGISTLNNTHGFQSHTLGSNVKIPHNSANVAEDTMRHDINVEEYYENGHLIDGREESKKWKNGQLVDSQSQTYQDSPRTLKHHLGQTADKSLALLSKSGRTTTDSQSCEVNQCLNGGTCRKSSTSTGILCMCKFGFNGTYCERAYCPTRFCRFGGTCSVSSGSHSCECQQGFTGHRCSTRVHKIRLAASG